MGPPWCELLAYDLGNLQVAFSAGDHNEEKGGEKWRNGPVVTCWRIDFFYWRKARCGSYDPRLLQDTVRRMWGKKGGRKGGGRRGKRGKVSMWPFCSVRL